MKSDPRISSEIQLLVAALTPSQPDRIYIFGSWARGEADELSDLDVVVIKQTTLPFLDRMFELARRLPPGIGAVDLLVYTPEEFAAMIQSGNAFAEMVSEEGWLVYNRAES